MSVAKAATSDRLWRSEIVERLAKAGESYDLPSKPDWAPLDSLSSSTQFEGIEVYGEHAVVEDGTFIAPADVYVTLVYDPRSKDRVEFHDSYPARVKFTVSADGVPTISEIQVDTSSFYE